MLYINPIGRMDTLSVDSKCSGGGGGTWVKFCWVCAAGMSEPLPGGVLPYVRYMGMCRCEWYGFQAV